MISARSPPVLQRGKHPVLVAVKYQIEAEHSHGLFDRDMVFQLREIHEGHDHLLQVGITKRSFQFGLDHSEWKQSRQEWIMARTETAAEKPKGSKPIYNARVKQNPDSEYMVTIGAAWPFYAINDEGDVAQVRVMSPAAMVRRGMRRPLPEPQRPKKIGLARPGML